MVLHGGACSIEATPTQAIPVRTFDNIQQRDIDFLFWLGWGVLRQIPMESAHRLMSRDFIEPTDADRGALVDGMTNYRVGITAMGTSMMERVCSRQDQRFVEPSLS